MADTARVIETVEDVESVCESPRASFEEYLECVHVSIANDRWDLVDGLSHKALMAVGTRKLNPMSVREAAMALASSVLQRAQGLNDLPPNVERAVERLEVTLRSSQGVAANQLADVNHQLAEILTLLTDDEAASYVSLCSRLRRFDRPDLGRIAATKALSQEPENSKALNTRGAAAVDIGDVRSALEDLDRAWQMSGDAYVATALSRAHAQADQLHESVRWAETALRLDPESAAALHTLAAAARLAGDETAFHDALDRINRLGPRQLGLFEDSGQRWISCIAARNLLGAGKATEAAALIDTVLADEPDYPRARRLRHEINAALRRRHAT